MRRSVQRQRVPRALARALAPEAAAVQAAANRASPSERILERRRRDSEPRFPAALGKRPGPQGPSLFRAPLPMHLLPGS